MTSNVTLTISGPLVVGTSVVGILVVGTFVVGVCVVTLSVVTLSVGSFVVEVTPSHPTVNNETTKINIKLNTFFILFLLV
jgi:hypothetical protein